MNLLETVQFRPCRAADVAACAELEDASYPPDEAASLSTLQNCRFGQAGLYFMVAILPIEDNDIAAETTNIVGFVCATRCRSFTDESMQDHEPDGPILAIHSVVVAEPYRRQGLASRMLTEYIQRILQIGESTRAIDTDTAVVAGQDASTIATPTTLVSIDGTAPSISRPSTIALLSKKHLLSFYVNCGFRVMRPSPITHGLEQWFDLEMDLAPPQQAARSKGGNRYYVVDSFALPGNGTGGTGNPAAVVPLDTAPNSNQTATQWMQLVALEFNLSETAFCWPLNERRDNEDASSSMSATTIPYGIRFFTPTMEVDLCGHATLAAAAVVLNELSQHSSTASKSATSIAFHAPKDVLLASLAADSKQKGNSGSNEIGSSASRITMTFPCMPVTELLSDSDVLHVESILRIALNIDDGDILYMGLANGLGDLFVEVTAGCFEDIGFGEQLNVNALLSWDGYSRGVIVCCCSSDPDRTSERATSGDNAAVAIDFASRFFAPKVGILEDPVTGSAHCALAPYFAAKLQKDVVVGRQASERGGIVECKLEKHDDKADEVKLTGTAISTMTGVLHF